MNRERETELRVLAIGAVDVGAERDARKVVQILCVSDADATVRSDFRLDVRLITSEFAAKSQIWDILKRLEIIVLDFLINQYN